MLKPFLLTPLPPNNTHTPTTPRLKRKIDMRRARVVVRGAGVNKTVIYIPVSLSDVYGNAYSEGSPGSGVSDYAHSTGFLNFWGYDPMTPWNALTNVTRAAKRGDTRLYVASTAKLTGLVGKQVRFIMDGDYESLLTDMYGGEWAVVGGRWVRRLPARPTSGYCCLLLMLMLLLPRVARPCRRRRRRRCRVVPQTPTHPPPPNTHNTHTHARPQQQQHQKAC